MKFEIDAGQLNRFKVHFADKTVLIADSSTVFRSQIAHVLETLGVKPQRILMAPTFDMALEAIELHQPRLLICDFELQGGSGLELMTLHRKNAREDSPNSQGRTREAICILATADASETAVARAAEGDVDGYVLKPFNLQYLAKTLVEQTLRQIEPTPYFEAIGRGRQFLDAKHFDEALSEFARAKKHHSHPSLACYFEGLAYQGKQRLSLAEKSFRDGLAYNPIHWKCLNASVDLLLALQRGQEAYPFAHELVKTYPLPANRLMELLKLAILTRNLKDLDLFYEKFINLPRRDSALAKAIAAAQVMTGRYHLEGHDMKLAISSFSKAAIASQNDPHLMMEISQALQNAGEPNAAEAFRGLKNFAA